MSINRRDKYLQSKPHQNLSQFVDWITNRHHRCGGVTEIRIIKDNRISRGYFDHKHQEQLIKAILPTPAIRPKIPYGDYPRIGEANIYFTLQAVDSDLLARSAYCIGQGQATSDTDVIAYQLFAVDIDPERKTGISSSDEEKQAAYQIVIAVKQWLSERGVESLLADSGNGHHLLVPTIAYTGDCIAETAENAHLLLQLLDKKFSTKNAKIDTTVYNQSRIFKLYGTKAMKGSDIPQRPHRWSSIDMENIPEDIDLFSVLAEEIEEFRQSEKPSEETDSGSPVSSGGSWDRDTSIRVLEELLRIGGFEFERKSKSDREIFAFKKCPLHTDDDSHEYECSVMVNADGKYGGSCKHDDKFHWGQFKDVIGWDKNIDSLKDKLGLGQGKKTQASKLIDLASDVELFHNAEDETFATVIIGDHSENWRLKTKSFRQWLARKYWEEYHKVPCSQAMQDALGVLSGKAIYDGPEKSVHARLAHHDEVIWLDLGNEDWEAVKITPRGWEIVANPPVKFLRPRGLLPLPAPSEDGNIGHLQKFLNLSSQDDWILITCWLVAALNPKGPYPVLVVNGEQGSAKSTLCRLLKRIADPNISSLRAVPREVRDLMIAASNSWVITYDNLSYIPAWLSDALCRLATGGGFSTRELFSDNEEIIFDAMRPVIINGISELATRSDLLDRSICITLPPVPDGKRKTEKQLYKEFEELQPQILGSLLDAVSAAMKKLPSIDLKSPPRMADFAALSVAAEESLSLYQGSFITAYTANRESAADLAIEVCAVGPAIQEFMAEKDYWEGTAGELLDELENDDYTSEKTRKRKDWPKSPQAMGKDLRRISPNIRRNGIDIQFRRGDDTKRKRLIQIEKCNLPSNMSEPSETTLNNT